MAIDPARIVAKVEDGVTVQLRVTPKASRAAVDGVIDDPTGGARLKVKVTTAPEGGKANAAVIKLLAKQWRLPAGAMSVIRGETDRNKLLRIDGDPADLHARLADWMERNLKA